MESKKGFFHILNLGGFGRVDFIIRGLDGLLQIVLKKMVRVTYAQVFVASVFRPAMGLLALLLIPFPPIVERNVIRLCDTLLFFLPHPKIPINLFWCIAAACTGTLLTDLQELQNVRAAYRLQKLENGLYFKDRDRWVIKILGAERGCWMSGCCLLMWIFIHRYRGLLKRYLFAKDDLKEKTLLSEQQRELILTLQQQLQHKKIPEATIVENVPASSTSSTTTAGPVVNKVPVHNFATTS